jgi:hypothetical protein
MKLLVPTPKCGKGGVPGDVLQQAGIFNRTAVSAWQSPDDETRIQGLRRAFSERGAPVGINYSVHRTHMATTMVARIRRRFTVRLLPLCSPPPWCCLCAQPAGGAFLCRAARDRVGDPAPSPRWARRRRCWPACWRVLPPSGCTSRQRAGRLRCSCRLGAGAALCRSARLCLAVACRAAAMMKRSAASLPPTCSQPPISAPSLALIRSRRTHMRTICCRTTA